MKIYFTLLILFSIVSTSFSQNIIGEWKGILTQVNGGFKGEYTFNITISSQKGSAVEGSTYICLIGKPSTFGMMKFKGTFKNNQLFFDEYDIYKQDGIKQTNYYWCYKKGTLLWSKTQGKMTFQGNWKGTASTPNCPPGNITVNKNIPEIPNLPTTISTKKILSIIPTNGITDEVVDATISIIDAVTGKKISKTIFLAENKKLTIEILSSKKVVVIVEAKNYASKKTVINILVENTERKILLFPNKKMDFVLKNVLFKQGLTEFIDGSTQELDNLVLFLNNQPKITKILIEGHTDNVGAYHENFRLSVSRAKTVVEYLISKGINSQRLDWKGFADKFPLVSNNTENGRRKNRRVSCKIQEIGN